jgi:taurine dioxygenase
MMTKGVWRIRPLVPFGVEIGRDGATALDDAERSRLRDLMARHKLILFRRQSLTEDAQVDLLSALGEVLGTRGEYREISSDGNLGAGPLAYHSDLAFTEEPFKYLSLHALEVNDGESWTSFASGTKVLETMPPDLRERLEDLEARTVISLVQSHRAVDYDNPLFLPQQVRPAIIAHPETGEPVLYISEMQTARIEGLDRGASDALLGDLFGQLYAPANVYRHHWHNGDVLIWDNIALTHSRCDLTGMTPRRLQRVAVANKSFFDLCPQFDLGDPGVAAWAAGEKLQMA